MTWVCMRCGAEVSSKKLKEQRYTCVKCKVSGSNIWFKKRPPQTKEVLAR